MHVLHPGQPSRTCWQSDDRSNGGADCGAALALALNEIAVIRGTMNITLNEEDAKTLRDFLEECLPDLKFEAARTEAQPLRTARPTPRDFAHAVT